MCRAHTSDKDAAVEWGMPDIGYQDGQPGIVNGNRVSLFEPDFFMANFTKA